jgi:hypothetical protein
MTRNDSSEVVLSPSVDLKREWHDALADVSPVILRFHRERVYHRADIMVMCSKSLEYNQLQNLRVHAPKRQMRKSHGNLVHPVLEFL